MANIGLLNRFIVSNAPWELAKQPDRAERLNTVLALLGGSLWMIAVALKPIMPETAAKMARALGMEAAFSQARLAHLANWQAVPARAQLGELVQLFPRLERKKEMPVKKEAAKSPAGGAELISLEQFRALDLRVAEIVAAQPVKKSDRLLQLTLHCPEERTVVSGIARYYRPEELLGKKVALVANLQPARLMGIVSAGMILAAREKQDDGTERLKLLFVDPAMNPGSEIA